MSQGVPGVPPPKVVLDALADASAAAPNCGYLPNAGDLALREAMVREMKVRYGDDADVAPNDLVITAGCNMAFCATAMTLADAGDEIILTVPWYGNEAILVTTSLTDSCYRYFNHECAGACL